MEFISSHLPIIFSITLVVIFIATLLIAKRQYRFETKKAIVRSLLITCGLGILLYITFILTVLGVISYVETDKFDKKDWANKVNDRWKMREDLVESRILIGLDSTSIKETIGIPTMINHSEGLWIYSLGGHTEGFSTVFSTIQVHYNQNKVINFKCIDSKD